MLDLLVALLEFRDALLEERIDCMLLLLSSQVQRRKSEAVILTLFARENEYDAGSELFFNYLIEGNKQFLVLVHLKLRVRWIDP